jgi:hypothetical protein
VITAARFWMRFAEGKSGPALVRQKRQTSRFRRPCLRERTPKSNQRRCSSIRRLPSHSETKYPLLPSYSSFRCGPYPEMPVLVSRWSERIGVQEKTETYRIHVFCKGRSLSIYIHIPVCQSSNYTVHGARMATLNCDRNEVVCTSAVQQQRIQTEDANRPNCNAPANYSCGGFCLLLQTPHPSAGLTVQNDNTRNHDQKSRERLRRNDISGSNSRFYGPSTSTKDLSPTPPPPAYDICFLLFMYPCSFFELGGRSVTIGIGSKRRL